MSNKEIFSRTFGFSVRRFFFSILSFIAAAAICLIGFLIGEKVLQKGLLGLGIGAIIGLIFLIIVLRYIAYSCKAAQIAMMTQGIVTGELPDDVIGEGKRIVKSRFKTVAVFFAVTGVIRGIFNQRHNQARRPHRRRYRTRHRQCNIRCYKRHSRVSLRLLPGLGILPR